MWRSTGFDPRVFTFPYYVHGMTQAVNANLFLYAGDSCLMFQHKEVEEIEKILNNDFENIFDWFADTTFYKYSFRLR